MYWFAVADAPAGGMDPEGAALQSLKHTYADWPLNVPAVLEATSADAILRTDIQDRDPVDHWGVGRITLLGDAAHPMTPNLGQGAGQAIEDALVLSEELSAGGDPVAALRRYEARRIPRTTKLVLASRKFGAVAHWSNPVARAVRNVALRHHPDLRHGQAIPRSRPEGCARGVEACSWAGLFAPPPGSTPASPLVRQRRHLHPPTPPLRPSRRLFEGMIVAGDGAVILTFDAGALVADLATGVISHVSLQMAD